MCAAAWDRKCLGSSKMEPSGCKIVVSAVVYHCRDLKSALCSIMPVDGVVDTWTQNVNNVCKV